jgi:hypothetical protein
VISEKVGTLLKKNTKTKVWWMKLGIALVISNLFFFLLFSGDSDVKQESLPSGIPQGWVEVQLNAELMTPFHSGKKVLLIHRIGRKKLEGVLQADQLGKITVLVKEAEAEKLFQHESWEILPYLKNLNFASVRKEASHEIRY